MKWLKPKKRFRPCIEMLENRLTPSVSTSFSGGNLTLTVDNAATPKITLTAMSNTSIDVKVGLIDLGTYANVANATVNEGNAASDSVAIALGGFTVATNFNLNLGGGATDSVAIDTVPAGGTITGRVTAAFGLGTGDTLTVGATNGVSLLGAFTVRGSNTGVAVAIDTASVLKSTNTFTNLADEPAALPTADAFSLSATATVPGNITINNGGVGAAATIDLIAASNVSGNVSVLGGTSATTVDAFGIIGGTLSFSGPGADTIAFAATTSVGTNVSLSFGSSTNTYTTTTTWTIGGGLTINAANGSNNIALGGSVGTNVGVTLGNGADSFTLNDGSTVGGNLTVNGGNVGVNVTLGGGASGSIGGNVTIGLGNGNNAFTQMAGFTIDGTSLRYTGGSGSDSFTIDNAVNGYSLSVNLGGTANLATGSDEVDLTNVTSLNSATLTWGVLGTAGNLPAVGVNKVWIPPTAAISFPITLNNFD